MAAQAGSAHSPDCHSCARLGTDVLCRGAVVTRPGCPRGRTVTVTIWEVRGMQTYNGSGTNNLTGKPGW